MKVEVQKQPVQINPVVITLETIDELIAMWHRMNLSGAHIRENTCDVDTFNNEKDWDLSVDIFNVIDDELSNLKIKPGVTS
jgi:hypothetical protein